MPLPKILVMGATGRIGRVAVSELLAKGYPVRAIVRREDDRSRALQAQGVEIAIGDMGDAERVANAMRGVQRAFFLPPYDPNMIRGAAAFAAAAATVRVEAIVSVSQWLASPSHPSQMTRDTWLSEKIFGNLPGIAYTAINTGLFADSPYLESFDFAAHLGVYPWAFGSRRDAPASIDDIGRVCAAALMDPDRHAGARYRPTGPALLGGRDMADALGRALNRKVRLVPLPAKMMIKAVKKKGEPDFVLGSLPDYIEDHNRGAFEFGGPTNVVRELTGREPESFEDVARRYASRVKRGIGPTIGQIAEFLAMPFAPGFDAETYNRELRLRAPAETRYAADSPLWRSEHGVDAKAVLPPRPDVFKGIK